MESIEENNTLKSRNYFDLHEIQQEYVRSGRFPPQGGGGEAQIFVVNDFALNTDNSCIRDKRSLYLRKVKEEMLWHRLMWIFVYYLMSMVFVISLCMYRLLY